MADQEEDSGVGPILLSACKRGNMNLLKQLVEEHKDKLPVNAMDGLGNGALHYAAIGDHSEIATLLFDTYGKEINVNLKNFAGDTPVHKAIEKNHLDFLSLLVEHAADPSIPNKKGKTPTMMAVSPEARNILKQAQLAAQVKQEAKATPASTNTTSSSTSSVASSSAPLTVKAEFDPDMIADQDDDDDE